MCIWLWFGQIGIWIGGGTLGTVLKNSKLFGGSIWLSYAAIHDWILSNESMWEKKRPMQTILSSAVWGFNHEPRDQDDHINPLRKQHRKKTPFKKLHTSHLHRFLFNVRIPIFQLSSTLNYAVNFVVVLFCGIFRDFPISYLPNTIEFQRRSISFNIS